MLVDMAILTTDADFQRFGKHLPIRLHRPGKHQTA